MEFVPDVVICEVHKLLLRYAGENAASQALSVMETAVEIVSLREAQKRAAIALVKRMPRWQGTLPDASVIVLTTDLKASVWTLDYRDFGRFKELPFWTPKES